MPKYVGSAAYTDALLHKAPFPGSKESIAWGEGRSGNPAANPHTAGTVDAAAYDAGAAASSAHEAFGLSADTAEALAVIANLTNIDAAEQAAVKAFVNGQVPSGNWAEVYEVQCYCLTTADALVGWMGNQTGTLISTPTHTKGEGYATTDTAVIDSLLDVDSVSPYTQNAAFASVYHINSEAVTATQRPFGQASGGTSNLAMGYQLSTDTFWVINDTTSQTATGAGGSGYDKMVHTLHRDSSTTCEYYIDGTQEDSATDTSAGISTTETVYVGARAFGGIQQPHNATYSFFALGGSLPNIAVWQAGIATLMSALGPASA